MNDRLITSATKITKLHDELSDLNNELLIGAFNIQILGATKMSKPEVVEVLVKILSRYDLVQIEEIRDKSGEAFQQLMDELNAANENAYDFYKCERQGRSNEGNKEQYGFIWRKTQFSKVQNWEYPDEQDIFERPPCVVTFQVEAITHFKYWLPIMAIHTSPSDAVKEIDALVDVYDAFQQDPNMLEKNNMLIMGDYNSDCSYVKEKDWANIRLRNDERFTWWIDDDADTTVASTDCAYDRIVSAGEIDETDPTDFYGTTDWTCCSSVFNYQEYYNLSDELAKNVSDHYPIEITFGTKNDFTTKATTIETTTTAAEITTTVSPYEVPVADEFLYVKNPKFYGDKYDQTDYARYLFVNYDGWIYSRSFIKTGTLSNRDGYYHDVNMEYEDTLVNSCNPFYGKVEDFSFNPNLATVDFNSWFAIYDGEVWTLSTGIKETNCDELGRCECDNLLTDSQFSGKNITSVEIRDKFAVIITNDDSNTNSDVYYYVIDLDSRKITEKSYDPIIAPKVSTEENVVVFYKTGLLYFGWYDDTEYREFYTEPPANFSSSDLDLLNYHFVDVSKIKSVANEIEIVSFWQLREDPESYIVAKLTLHIEENIIYQVGSHDIIHLNKVPIELISVIRDQDIHLIPNAEDPDSFVYLEPTKDESENFTLQIVKLNSRLGDYQQLTSSDQNLIKKIYGVRPNYGDGTDGYNVMFQGSTPEDPTSTHIYSLNLYGGVSWNKINYYPVEYKDPAIEPNSETDDNGAWYCFTCLPYCWQGGDQCDLGIPNQYGYPSSKREFCRQSDMHPASLF